MEPAHIWINEVADEVGPREPPAGLPGPAPSCTRSESRSTLEESAQLAAQLPTLVRRIYYEGWRPSATPLGYHDRETFLRKIADEALLAGSTEASYAVTAAAAVVGRQCVVGEIADVLARRWTSL